MALNDVYEVTLNQQQRGQDMSNVFHLHQQLAFVSLYSTTAQTLAENFQAQVLSIISQFQSAEVVTTSVRARNLFDSSDDFTQVLAIPGTQPDANSSLPQFAAVSFSLNGDNPSVKNGSKRFAGLTEEQQVDGIITNAFTIPELNAVGTKLAGYVTVGTIIQDNVFKFVIVKRIRTGTPGNYSYRLPENSLEAVLSAVIVAVWKALITSQISRKIGVGA
jgi:hypothetical protein